MGVIKLVKASLNMGKIPGSISKKTVQSGRPGHFNKNYHINEMMSLLFCKPAKLGYRKYHMFSAQKHSIY